MKRIALAILVLTPLLPTSAFAQAEQPQKEHLKMQISELKQQLNASHYASENLRRELDALVERNHQQQDEIQSRMLAAIEAELKATLEKDSVLKQMGELEARFTAVNQDVRGRLAEVEQQRQALENEVAQLNDRLSQSKSESHNLEGDLKTAIYVSKYMEGQQLAILAGQAFGDRVAYSRLDPISFHTSGGFRQRFTSISGGNHVLVTDFPDQLKKALDLLIEIDASFMQESQTVATKTKPTVVVYRPKALEAYEVIEMLSHSFASQDSAPNMSEMPGTGAVRIEGSEADVKEALAQLEANDQFPAQVRIRAYLVHTETDPNIPEIALPKKLVSGLQGALPGQEFYGLASMLVQTSVGSGQSVRAMTRPSPQASVGEWNLTSAMKAYDADTGILSLQQCSFQVEFASNVERLSADLLLRKDEYTVIGSIRGGSMYLVLSFEEI